MRARWIQKINQILKSFLQEIESHLESFQLAPLARYHFADLTGERLIILAHYDPDHIFDPAFLYLIEKMKLDLNAKVMVVSTSTDLSKSQIDVMSKYVECLIIKKNYGRDFASWQLGLRELGSFQNYQSLIISNDTLYGPFSSLHSYIKKIEDFKDPVIGGLTDSFETGYHLQSYFLAFNQACLNTPWFLRYWKTYRSHQDRMKTIAAGEKGLSQSAQKAGIQLIAMCEYKNLKNFILQRNLSLEPWRQRLAETAVNPYHFMWKELIQNFDFPFIKVELLKLNPWNIDKLADYTAVVSQHCNYPVSLIANHLSRMKSKRQPAGSLESEVYPHERIY